MNKATYKEKLQNRLSQLTVGEVVKVETLIKEIWECKKVDFYITRSFDVYFSNVRGLFKEKQITFERKNKSIKRLS